MNIIKPAGPANFLTKMYGAALKIPGILRLQAVARNAITLITFESKGSRISLMKRILVFGMAKKFRDRHKCSSENDYSRYQELSKQLELTWSIYDDIFESETNEAHQPMITLPNDLCIFREGLYRDVLQLARFCEEASDLRPIINQPRETYC